MVILLTGCDQGTPVRTSDNNVVYVRSRPGDELCYNGVVYIKFGESSNSWGGAKFGRDGRVVTCG